nr:MAG TPA: hypothetical protein [Caudoviricetes sp.]
MDNYMSLQRYLHEISVSTFIPGRGSAQSRETD